MNFAKHELREKELMDAGMDYEKAHEATLKEHGMFYQGYENKLYTKEAIEAGNAADLQKTLE